MARPKENHMEHAPEVIRNFLSHLETIQGKSKNTVKEYFLDLRTFFRFMVRRQPGFDATIPFDKTDISCVNVSLIDSVTLSDLYDFLAYTSRQRDNAANARARKVASLKAFFKYCAEKARIISANPAKDLESPKIMKSLPKYLSLNESRNLLDAVEGEHATRDRAILVLFLNCGMRLSELVGINLNKIKGDVLTVIGKGNKERAVYLNQACLEAIKEYLKDRPADGVKDPQALFLSERRQRISPKTVQYLVKKHIGISGLDTDRYSTHKLRHTAATLMYKHGQVDIRALQEILGHQSIATTEIYTHVDNERLRQAIERNPLSDYGIKNSKDDQ